MTSTVRVALRPIAPLYLIWLVLLAVLVLTLDSLSSTVTGLWWLGVSVAYLGLLLPFLLFGSGVALAQANAPSLRLTRRAICVAVSLAAFAYVLLAWVHPELNYRNDAARGVEAAGTRPFGASTPPGILRNLRFVEANPPDQYSMRVSEPHATPPDVLRWDLHYPVVLALFGIANVFLGALAAKLTVGLRGKLRRSARLAMGLAGGLLFFACVDALSPAQAFRRGGTLWPGVVAAWLPLTVPLIEGVVLLTLLRRRVP